MIEASQNQTGLKGEIQQNSLLLRSLEELTVDLGITTQLHLSQSVFVILTILIKALRLFFQIKND